MLRGIGIIAVRYRNKNRRHHQHHFTQRSIQSIGYKYQSWYFAFYFSIIKTNQIQNENHESLHMWYISFSLYVYCCQRYTNAHSHEETVAFYRIHIFSSPWFIWLVKRYAAAFMINGSFVRHFARGRAALWLCGCLCVLAKTN